MRKIHSETIGEKTAKVYHDSEWSEYRVRLYINGAHNLRADYHTSDRADALETAASMVRPTPPNCAPLSIPFNVAVLHIAGKLLPCGFDISINAPGTLESLIAHHEKTGRICVWSGASKKTIFGDSEVNFAFRAWHDSKHILHRLRFTYDGERAACQAQQNDIRALYNGGTADYFCSLLDAEIIGQFRYEERRGGFPINQIGFTRHYLRDKSAALSGDYGVSIEG